MIDCRGMDTYRLHIPAWYNAETGRNVDECEETIFLPFPPFKGMQIDVANVGIVEVSCVRVSVQRHTHLKPRVHLFTNWVQYLMFRSHGVH